MTTAFLSIAALLVCQVASAVLRKQDQGSFSDRLQVENKEVTLSKENAERLASVLPEPGVSGYIRVNPEGDDLFYWMFPARNNPETAPLVFWFQGGPGSTSMYALLWELGPANIVDGQAVINPESWNVNYNLVFVDHPIGTGFSHGASSRMVRTAEDA